jgi:hypothetical protein
MENHTENNVSNGGNGSIVAGVILIAIGGLYLLKDYFPNISFSDLWPYILIGIGIMLLVKGLKNK